VIRVLAEMANLNMIHSPDLRGVVTIHLEQVPFDEAFNTILTMYGLVAQQMGDNVLRILTPEALSTDRSRAVTSYKTYTLNYAKAAEVMTHLVSVRISPNGKITVDERSNSLIVTDTPEGLLAAERLIADLDKKPQQVMIEAKMVEIGLSDTMDLGIQWEYAQTDRTGAKASTLGQRKVTPGATEVPAGEAGFVSGGNVEQAVAAGQRGTGVSLPGPQSAAITFGFINNSNLLTATLTALATKGQTKILSSPKVITVNNKQAKIQVGSRIPFSITTVAATGVATQSFQFVDTGIILTVTPTINADNRIRINVKPEVSFPGAVGPAGPEINTRTAETEVIVQDGETLVIGGLIDEQMRESASKVPLLGDIPVLGVFFRNTHDEKRRTELLVFLTPRIIRE
jgi:type IV pilus assembly protein PilQ